MKFTQQITTFLFTIALVFLASCELSVPPFIGPTDRPDNGGDTIIPPAEAPDTIGWNIPAEAITIAEAREICAGLESGANTGTKYYVMGYVKKLHNNHASGISGYGNAQFYMEDVKGANSSDDFMAFQVYGLNGTKLTDPNTVAVGDFVVIYGELTNYNGTYETVGKGAAYIWKSTNPLLAPSKPEPKEVTLLDESLTTGLGSLNVANIKGEEEWKYVGGKTKAVQMNGKNMENEDWLITPALDLTNMSEATLTFKYRFSEAIAAEHQGQYTVLVSKNYDGNVANINNATWVPLTGISYDAITVTESGDISLPAEMIGNKCHIAWKYNCSTVSHTWLLRDVVIKAMTKVD